MSTLPWSTNEAGVREVRLHVERQRRTMLDYPFPVDDGYLIARLRLPKDLTRLDADRLRHLIDTLVMAE